jgi:hypothetical protein
MRKRERTNHEPIAPTRTPEPAPAPRSTLMLRDALIEPEILIEETTVELPASVIMTNAGRIGLEAFERSMVQSVYRARHGTFEPVMLGRLPPGATMPGGDWFLVRVNDALISEQINPLAPDIHQTYTDLIGLPYEHETIEAECLLVARYGDVTWGHWIGEILPRAIMAEQAHPGRFTFVVGAKLIEGSESGGYAKAILDSLAAFGIGPDRLLGLRVDRHYEFTALFAVSGIWSVAGMNPGVMNAMRSAMRRSVEPATHHRIAILRRGAHTRNLCNAEAVEALLQAEDFAIPVIEEMNFREQVALFLGCEMVFAIQGSGMIGLIFAPQHVKVLSLAPAAWKDTYFHPIIQAREGYHADLRGPTLWTGEGLERDAPFLGIEADIRRAIETLERAPVEIGEHGIIRFGALSLSRRPGRIRSKLQFGAGNVVRHALTFGWSVSEENHTWSVGPFSVVRLPRPDVSDTLAIELDLMALVLEHGLIGRPIDVVINGTVVGSALISGLQTIAFTVPPACYARTDRLEIAFLHPVFLSPRATGHGADDRDTAIAFLELRLVEIPSARSNEQQKAA